MYPQCSSSGVTKSADLDTNSPEQTDRNDQIKSVMSRNNQTIQPDGLQRVSVYHENKTNWTLSTKTRL